MLKHDDDRPDEVLVKAITSSAVKAPKTKRSKEHTPPQLVSLPKETATEESISPSPVETTVSTETPSVESKDSSTHSLPSGSHSLKELINMTQETKQEPQARKRNTIAVYACGGMGITAGKTLKTYFSDLPDGFANLDIYNLDTSQSNLDQAVDKTKVYLIPNKDGSGQKRNLNSSSIMERVKEITRNFKPADLNIVISSASGGSGSVLNPLVTRELVSSKFPVIVIVVGDLTTRKFAENTIGTLRSFENFTRVPDARPIIMAYFENKGAHSRKEVNDRIIRLVADLSCLFSGQNAELDSQDLFHWLNYQDVTDGRVQLANLSVLHDGETLDEETYGGPIAVATLSQHHENTDYPVPVDYHTVGLTAPGVYHEDAVTHFVITDGYFDKVIARMQKQIENIDELKATRVQRQSLVTQDSNVDDETGLVF